MVLFLVWLVIFPVAMIVTQMELNKLAGQATASSGEVLVPTEESSVGSEEASNGDQD